MAASKTDRLRVARDTLASSQRAAVDFAEQAGRKELESLLKDAASSLERRLLLMDAAGLSSSFTAVQMRATLAQVGVVLGPLTKGMRGVLLDVGARSAEEAAKYTVDYLAEAERAFSGIAQPLALDRARMMSAAVRGANSSLLSRIARGPEPKAKKHHAKHARARHGILQRYGLSTIEHFEKRMRVGLVAKQSWREMRDGLIEESPFLQGAPKHWAERILRTETMTASGAGALESTKEANKQLGDVVKILSCVFDERTNSDSVACHGQIRRPEEDFLSWNGPFAHPADRPNDRAVITTHRLSWPIPEYLKPREWDEVLDAWKREGRKGAPPERPEPMSTVQLGTQSSQTRQ